MPTKGKKLKESTGTETETKDAKSKTAAAEVPETAVPEEPGPGLDVDVEDIPSKHRKGEVDPLIPSGAWVRLGKHDDVPDGFEGKIAQVTDAPLMWRGPDDHSPRPYQIADPDGEYTVQVRDETNAILTVHRDAFAAVGLNGRHEVASYG